MATISNRTKQIQVFNVPCRPGCTGSDCLCSLKTLQLADELPDGTRGIRVIERRIPGSVTILAGEKKDIPDWVATAPDVKSAIDRGVLRLL